MSRNQCDGCVLGLPVINGLHINLEGKPYMCCCKDTYKLDKVDLKILENINSEIPSESPSEHVLRLRLQAFGYCKFSSKHDFTSFSYGENEFFWHLTEPGYEIIDNICA